MADAVRENGNLVPQVRLRAGDSAERAAELFKALADPVRVRLVAQLRSTAAGEECFCGLAGQFDMPQPTLSHHLGVLVKAGILVRQRRGTWSWYRVCPEAWETLGRLVQPGGVLHGSDPFADDRCE